MRVSKRSSMGGSVSRFLSGSASGSARRSMLVALRDTMPDPKAVRRSCSVLLALGLFAAPAAFARDLCILDAGGANRLTIRGWKVPSAGRCRAFVGTGDNGVAHGTVCLSTEGDVLRFGATIHRPSGIFVNPYTDSTAFMLEYPSLSNDYGANIIRVTFSDNTVTSYNWTAMQGSLCTGADIN